MAKSFASSLNMVMANKQEWESSRWEDVEKFIGPNAGKYKNLWEKQRTNMMTKGKPGWVPNFCWTSLLLVTLPWSVARKQYGLAGMAAVFLILVNVFALPPGAVGGTAILLAATVKNMYLQFAVNQLAKIDASGLTGEARDVAIRAAGGLDTRNGVIAGVATVLVVFVLAFVF
jgi:hypothetical protein